MVRIDSNLNMGKAFLSGDKETINGGITVEDLQAIAHAVAYQYKGEEINVKNIFDVMEQIFQKLDTISNHLTEETRKELANDLIFNVIAINRDNEAQAFSDRALMLLVDYSLDTVASETWSSRADHYIDKSEPEVKETLVEPDLEVQPEEMDVELQQEEVLSRQRIESVVAKEEEVVEASLEFPEEAANIDDGFNSTFLEQMKALMSDEEESPVAASIESVQEVEELPAELSVPSVEATSELVKAVTANTDAIENQVQEALQYVREATIEVDEKIMQAQQELNLCIENAMAQMDQATRELKELLKTAKDESTVMKAEVTEAVTDMAERLIEALSQSSSGEAVHEDFENLIA